MTDEAQLDAAVDAWLELRANGDDVPIDAFVGRYPAVAEELRGLLQTMAGLDELHAPRTEGVGTACVGGAEYTVERLLGRGGMGEVWLARDPDTGHEVAIKVLSSPFAADAERRARFEREAMLGRRLRHPGIVAVHGRGTWNGLPCLAMDYVRGIDLGRLLGHLRRHGAADLQGCDLAGELRRCRAEADTPPPAAVAGERPGYYAAVAHLVAALADALQFAHDQGIVHRDVKPQNVLLDDELRPHLLDFGLAWSREEQSLSRSGDQIGTLHYMSPEMVRLGATRVDHRTDVYSLGVVLYELTTLSLPFAGPSSPAIIRSIERDPTPWPRRRNPDVPHDLQGIVLRALGKRPQQRYATAGEMAADLRRFLRFERVQARTPGPVQRLGTWFVRHRRLASAVAVVAAVAGGSRVVSAYERGAEYDRLLAEATAAQARGEAFAAFGALQRAAALQPDPELLRRLRHLEGERELRLLDVPAGAEVSIRRLPQHVGEHVEALGRHRADGTELHFDIPQGEYLVVVDAGDSGLGEYFVALDRTDPVRLQCRLLPPATVTADMVAIPAGEYPVGQGEGPDWPTLAPALVTVPSFWIDATEVSNAAYARFCRATGHAPPDHWGGIAPPASMQDLPVVRVSWFDAVAYAEWAGKRLPTSVEWEVAARGRNGRLFPWGDALLDADVAVRGLRRTGQPTIQEDAGELVPVTFANLDRTPEGVSGLCGNAEEWVLDLWLPRSADPPPGAMRAHGQRVLRGGSVGMPLMRTTCLVQNPAFPDEMLAHVGFRCARSRP